MYIQMILDNAHGMKVFKSSFPMESLKAVDLSVFLKTKTARPACIVSSNVYKIINTTELFPFFDPNTKSHLIDQRYFGKLFGVPFFVVKEKREEDPIEIPPNSIYLYSLNADLPEPLASIYYPS